MLWGKSANFSLCNEENMLQYYDDMTSVHANGTFASRYKLALSKSHLPTTIMAIGYSPHE